MDNNDQENDLYAKTLVERVLGFVNKIWSIRFFRFLFVGGINSLFGYLVFSIFILLKINKAIALLIATILGVLFNFFTTGRIVFKNKDPRLLIKFFGVYGVTYLINLFFLELFNGHQINILIAQAILMFPIALLSYFLNRTLVFRIKDNTINK
jgi:putative flippase GtrA